MSEDREYARERPLPLDEVELLTTMGKKERYYRAKQLFDAGWTLQSIGNAFDPVQKRSTVQYWTSQANLKFDTNKRVPSPWGGFVDAPMPKPIRGYQLKKPKSPGIPKETQERLRYLAPLARYYRSGMSSTSLNGLANSEMNEIVQDLYNKNVKIAEIAKAAGVTSRAIARRLGK
jgi:hypothetical protein